MLALLVLFGGSLLFLALVSFASIAVVHPHPRRMPSSLHHRTLPPVDTGLPRIPRTAYEAHEILSDKEFELFSAAVVIGQGIGHTFLSHAGGSGDRGVDTWLLNMYQKLVVVQSKRYLYRAVPVLPEQVRDFCGAIQIHGAVNGYLVTTSILTVQAQQEVQGARGFIHVIDAPRLDNLLHYHARAIAVAYQEVLNTVNMEEQR